MTAATAVALFPANPAKAEETFHVIHVRTQEPLPAGGVRVQATIHADGAMVADTLPAKNAKVLEGMAGGNAIHVKVPAGGTAVTVVARGKDPAEIAAGVDTEPAQGVREINPVIPAMEMAKWTVLCVMAPVCVCRV